MLKYLLKFIIIIVIMTIHKKKRAQFLFIKRVIQPIHPISGQ